MLLGGVVSSDPCLIFSSSPPRCAVPPRPRVLSSWPQGRRGGATPASDASAPAAHGDEAGRSPECPGLLRLLNLAGADRHCVEPTSKKGRRVQHQEPESPKALSR